MVTIMPAPMPELSFPPGTPVCVTEVTWRRDRSVEVRTVGVVDAWEEMPTGSWHAHGRKDRLWLRRLKLRKLDGEVTLLVVDDGTSMAKLKPAKN
jgi:hypothetical protein